MSLIDCKECGHQISKAAKSCPSCGSPNKPKSSGGLGVLIIGIMGLVVIPMIYLSNVNPSAPAKPRTKLTEAPAKPRIELTETQKKKKSDDRIAGEIELFAKRKIKASLKDPDSFEWVGTGYTENEILGFVVFGSYRAKNSFGGYVVVRFIASSGTVIIEGEPRFQAAWDLI